MLRCITIDELLPGMYVNQVLDDTGKIRVRSKGVVRSDKVIDTLRKKGVQRVEIDCTKGLQPSESPQVTAVVDTPLPTSLNKTKDQPLTADNLQVAGTQYQKVVDIQQRFLDQLKSGKGADLTKVNRVSQQIFDCVLEHKEALMCLNNIQQGKHFLLDHSINCSIYIAVLAHDLGYSQHDVEEASLAGLLMDSGLANMPIEICVPEHHLNDEQMHIYQQHIHESLALVKNSGELSDTIATIILQHHERVDGSGFPEQLCDDEIFVLARVAAVVDEFSRLVMPAPFGQSLSNDKALKVLSQHRGLDQVIVNRLIGLLGIYPVGSLVKLSSGKLAIVSQKNPTNLLTPVVMTFYSINSGHYSEIKRLDLAKSHDEIETGIGPQEFAINLPKFFSEVFVHQMPA